MQGRMKDSETPEGLVLTDEIRRTVNAAIEALPEDLRLPSSCASSTGCHTKRLQPRMDCPWDSPLANIQSA